MHTDQHTEAKYTILLGLKHTKQGKTINTKTDSSSSFSVDFPRTLGSNDLIRVEGQEKFTMQNCFKGKN